MTIGYAMGLVSYFIILPGSSFITRAVAAWDIGSFFYLIASFIRILRTLDRDIRIDAKARREGEWTVFTLTILGAIMSFASILVFTKLSGGAQHKIGSIAFVGITLALSWTLTQTCFAYRYAHEYYSYDLGGPEIDGGISFPGNEPPDYLDFIYFAFTFGMTFQASDCSITAKKLRRLAILQGLIGFLFNTVILALAVNIAAPLL